MILSKETYEKFGYYPGQFTSTGRVNRKYVVRCKDCKKVFDRPINSVNRSLKRTGCILCIKCSHKIGASTSVDLRRSRINLSMTAVSPSDISFKLWIDLYTSYNAIYDKVGRLQCMRSTWKGGPKIDRVPSARYLAELGIDPLVKTSKAHMKRKLVEYFDKKPISYQFSIINYFFENCSSKDVWGTGAYLSMSFKDKGFLFNRVAGYNVKPSCGGRTTVIKKGSFYVNGRWVHIEPT